MKNLIILISIGMLSILSCSKKKEATMPPFVSIVEQPKVYSFEAIPSWTDEFDANGLPDTSKWQYDTGGGGWGNNELQYYTNTGNNVNANGGILSITAKKESSEGMNYTSARLVSKPSGMLYGRIEVKAKLPAGRGTWPAIWMLPNDDAYGSWPNSGEIDIMEHVGYDPNNVHFSIHNLTNNAGNSKTSILNIPTAMSAYHVYRCDWTPESIKGYYDDELVFTFLNDKKGFATWPFDKPFHIMLNLAVGGNWGGAQGIDDTVFPAAMQVDYVHYYKLATP